MGAFITVFGVVILLGLLQNLNKKQEKKQNKNQYIMRVSKSIFWLGMIELIIIIVLVVLIHLTSYMDIVSFWVTMVLALLGVTGILLATPGIWEIRVDYNDIKVVKFYKVRKKIEFTDITSCVKTSGGYKVFVNDQKNQHFLWIII